MRKGGQGGKLLTHVADPAGTLMGLAELGAAGGTDEKVGGGGHCLSVCLVSSGGMAGRGSCLGVEGVSEAGRRLGEVGCTAGEVLCKGRKGEASRRRAMGSKTIATF